jgi:hypothetical protein
MGIKRSRELHVCPACGGNLVQPLDFVDAGPGRWYVERLCPSCWWSHSGIHDQAQIDRFDDELARGEEAILAALEALTRSSMLEAVDRFAEALAVDAILPMDF